MKCQLTADVAQVTGNYGAFAAVKHDGLVVAWGAPENGGDSVNVTGQLATTD